MIIHKIGLREIHLPLKEPFKISSGTQDLRRIFLIEMTDADGLTEWGECVAPELPNYMPETVETAWYAIREWLAPRLIGLSVDEPASVAGVLQDGIRGHRMAKAGLEMTCWALTAKKRRIPLARLLGGTREQVATGISIGIQDNPLVLVDKVTAYLQAGYQKIKMKIKPGADVAFVQAVREEFGTEAPLMADANNAYSLDDIYTFRRLDQLGLLMIEQPLDWDDLVRHAELQRQLKTPVCLDESITKVERAQDMITLGSGKIINIKPGRVGGFASSIAIHDLCRQHGIPVWCGGMLESGIGRAYNVALASLPNFSLPGDLSPSSRYWNQDIVAPEWTMNKKGMVSVPLDHPGLGISVDLDRIDNLTVRRETVGEV